MSHRTRLISIAAGALALAATLLLWPAGAALAAITFQSQNTGQNGNAGTLVINKPSGVQVGDFLLAQITYEKGTDNTVSGFQAPPGWSPVRRTDRFTDIGQAIFYKFADLADATTVPSYTWTFSQSLKAAGGILRYSGVDDTTPIVTASGNHGESNPLTALSVSAEANSMLVAFFGVKKTTTLSVPTGMTGRYIVQNSQDITSRAADQDVGAGSTGNRASTAGSVDKWVAQLVALRSAPETPLDTDEDGVPDVDDNCPDDPNDDQADADGDGVGDVCEPDTDDDGVIDDIDNCVDDENPNQADADNDGIGDACDADGDNDGVNDNEDNCPLESNPDQADADGDGVGDVCDTPDDADGDGIPDGTDLCLGTPAGEIVDGTGCSIAQLCPCDNEWKNHGAYVSCVAKAAEDFLDLGLIDETEKDAIVSAAGQSQCGSKK